MTTSPHQKTVLITGASTGIGKATAQYFYAQGRNVVATMRSPEKEKELTEDNHLKILHLDVEDRESIDQAVQKTLEIFGTLDVLVNNAGYGAVGPIEAGTDADIHKQFDVNVFGVINCIKAVLPHMRSQKSGTIINISSIGGLLAIPSRSLYNASKFAIEGLSEGLLYELKGLGITVKLIEPGAIQTDFGGRSMDNRDYSAYPEYDTFMKSVGTVLDTTDETKSYTAPSVVAKVIYKAATDNSYTLRYRAGTDAKGLWFVRRWLGARFQMWLLGTSKGLK